MHFKDENNRLHFLSNEDIANGGVAYLPAGCVEITDEEADAIRAEQLAAMPVLVPQEVTRFQARAALYQFGLLDDVEAAVADPATDMMLKLAWQDALSFKRTSSFVLGMAAKLGLTEEQLDALFIAAGGVE